MALPVAIIGAVAAGAVAAGAIVVRTVLGPSHRRLLRELQAGTNRSIASLRDREIVRVVGRVEVRGRVVTAPLSHRPCAAWELSVWQPLGTTGARRSWGCVGGFGDHVPFGIRDRTGEADVVVEQLRGYGVVDREEEFADLKTLSQSPRGAELRALLVQHGILKRTRHKLPLHVKESALESGELAVIVGQVKRRKRGDDRVDYRSNTTEAEVMLSAPPGRAVLFSDAPEAIDPVSVRK